MSQRRSVQEIHARRIAGNRVRKISAYSFSAAGVVLPVAMWLTGSSIYEGSMTGLSCMALAELLDINIALRGGE